MPFSFSEFRAEILNAEHCAVYETELLKSLFDMDLFEKKQAACCQLRENEASQIFSR